MQIAAELAAEQLNNNLVAGNVWGDMPKLLIGYILLFHVQLIRVLKFIVARDVYAKLRVHLLHAFAFRNVQKKMTPDERYNLIKNLLEFYSFTAF